MLGQLGGVGPARRLLGQPRQKSAHIASAFDRLRAEKPQGAQLGWFNDVWMVWMRRLLRLITLGYVIKHGATLEEDYKYDSLNGHNVNFDCKIT